MSASATTIEASVRRAGAVRYWLKRLHLWVGLSVGLVYALIALSGSVLVLRVRCCACCTRRWPRMRCPTPPRARRC